MRLRIFWTQKGLAFPTLTLYGHSHHMTSTLTTHTKRELAHPRILNFYLEVRKLATTTSNPDHLDTDKASFHHGYYSIRPVLRQEEDR